ncbi:hypothetical protein Hdeb2414_s0012g00391111 [Helianthus debilis subsp. tardiflorus]
MRLEDFGDLFNEGKINALTRKVSIQEKSKAVVEAELKETKEKLKDIEAENVALREEVEEQSEVIEGLVDKIMKVRAQYKSMDESHQMLMEVVGNLHTSTANENEVLKKEVEALRADKEIKDKQLNMLYTVIENKLGINVQAVYNEIEIQRVEARRIEREKKIVEEAKEKRKGLVIDTEEILGSSSQQEQPKPDDEVNTSNVKASNDNDVEMKEAKVGADVNVEVSHDIVAIGEVKDVPHSEWASLRQIEVERRRLREKMNKFKVVEEDKELDELFGDEDEDEDDDEKDDKDDKDKDDKDDKGDDDDDC